MKLPLDMPVESMWSNLNNSFEAYIEVKMKQLILEIDETTEARIFTAAKTAGLSAQQWLRRIIDEKTVTSWPDSVKALAGTWQDVPFAEELRNGEGHDVSRESF